MTRFDALDAVSAIAQAAGVPLPVEAIRAIVAALRPDLVVIEAPVVTVEIAPGVDLAGLARHEGGDA